MLVEYTIENSKPIIHLYYRKDKKRIHETIFGHRPYFYVNDNDSLDETDYRIADIQFGHRDMYGNKLKKIFCKMPKYVKQLKQFFPYTYEADVLFTDVYLNEKQPKFYDEPKVMYLDIEVYSDTGKFPLPKEAKHPICGISFADNYESNYTTLFLDKKQKDIEKIDSKIWINRITKKSHIWKIHTYNSEIDLLNKFLTYTLRMNPDILTGWYVDFFDMPYIINRMKNLGVNYQLLSPLRYVDVPEPFETMRGTLIKKPPRIKGRYLFDLLPAYRLLHGAELSGNDLDTISDLELGVKKVEYKGNLFQLYLKDKELFKEYNMSDVELCIELDKKISIISKFYRLSKFIKCSLDKTVLNSRMLDMFNLQYAKHIRKIALPSKDIHESRAYKGAIVLEPKSGIHKNIIVLDLNRIYPNIILSYNMSPETLVINPDKNDKNIMVIDDDIGFRQDIDGFCPDTLKTLYKLRDEKKAVIKDIKDVNSDEYKKAKDDEQYVKDLTNSYYGDLGFVGSRLYNLNIAESVTKIGRRVIEWCFKKMKERGYEILYTDTDSIFLYSKSKEFDDIVKEGYDIENYVNESMNEFATLYNIKSHQFVIGFEKIFDTLVFVKKATGETAKKKYFGLISYLDGKNVNKKEFKNFEVMKSDASLLIKNMLGDIVNMILNNKTEMDIVNHVNGKNNGIFEYDFYKIGMPKGIRQELKKYKSKGAHIVGANYSNKYLDTHFDIGTKPMYCYVKHNNFKCRKHISTYVISYDMNTIIPNCFEPDYETIIKRLIIGKLKRLFISVGWNINNIKLGNKGQTEISNYF